VASLFQVGSNGRAQQRSSVHSPQASRYFGIQKADKKCVSSVGISIENVKWYSFTEELVQIAMENLRLI
jgi:hypothetical protein